jgi:hypothetical protein
MAFEKIKKFISRKKEIPGDLWMKCPDCKGMIFKKEVEDRKKVCTECQYHFTITPQERLDLHGRPGDVPGDVGGPRVGRRAQVRGRGLLQEEARRRGEGDRARRTPASSGRARSPTARRSSA